eukprot:CAMPEP_0170627550 /NCGR_PEP_ID=MMETSP0224-20130122/32041_1 /TAXON_ID=285029 /ORGANISM="Togula jolla, Strain CCCM 725" /LENGTH=106 /DNA_ID=CAMNT_0010954577 /DNA_START=506 /DNA_END=823 /DNA_ORIENTATION=-
MAKPPRRGGEPLLQPHNNIGHNLKAKERHRQFVAADDSAFIEVHQATPTSRGIKMKRSCCKCLRRTARTVQANGLSEAQVGAQGAATNAHAAASLRGRANGQSGRP